jgi:hypothetical protein
MVSFTYIVYQLYVSSPAEDLHDYDRKSGGKGHETLGDNHGTSGTGGRQTCYYKNNGAEREIVI